MTVAINAAGPWLEFRTPYSEQLVSEMKALIPASDRKWDGAKKVWLVAPAHGQTLQNITFQHFGVRPFLPDMRAADAPMQTKILEVRYLGRVKQHGTEESAYAWIGGKWAAIFTKAALYEWFGQTSRPGEAPTLYQVLGVKDAADAAEIKAAYKRMVRQWHPDVCKEPDAAKQFRAIKEAYEVIGEPAKRARYDVGLKLQALAGVPAGGVLNTVSVMKWGPPLRCGLVMCEGQNRLGGFTVTKILAWQDITRADGAILVSSWPMGADKPVEVWI